MIQLFCFSSSGLIGSGYNTKEADEHLFIGIGVVNEQRTNRAEEL
jgi:hypothetical protein